MLQAVCEHCPTLSSDIFAACTTPAHDLHAALCHLSACHANAISAIAPGGNSAIVNVNHGIEVLLGKLSAIPVCLACHQVGASLVEPLQTSLPTDG
jgi:hypothetical protein